MPETDELRLLGGWNDTEVPFAADVCLHELFEEQVVRTPDAQAVVFGERSVSYGELDRWANRQAYALRAAGVGPDDAVGVLVDRSVELVVSLLAVLKAGGAFLPLDPRAPVGRTAAILRDAGAGVCVAGGAFAGAVPEGVRVLVADADRCEQWPEERPVVGVRPGHLVSVYYTSGSTGRPKGVASVHEGWVNRMQWMQRKHGLRPGETVLHKTTLTFDDSCLEIFWPLAYGGRVVLIEPGRHRDPRAILDAAITSRAVLLQTVPSMLNMLLDTITPQDKEALALRAVVSSGEALLPGTVRRFAELFPGRLHNTWGATEVSIDSTIHTCGPEDFEDVGAVSIGVPFDNNRVTVRDAHLNEVPVGVTGDLYTSGVGLARCYLNDPVKTAAAFVPDPDRAGERMYRTGDQGYRRPDGSLKFAGRNDHQVKIRGMRVELGEIEAALSRHPQIGEAVVVVQAAASGLNRLAAHIVLAGDGALSPGEARAHLAGELPEHMVPSFVLVHDELPLNANGKVDRKQLPQPDRLRDYNEVPFVAPERDTEIALAEIWQELLGVERVGIRDSFFALGGHSLAVTRLNSRILRRFGTGLPLQVIFDRPTIEAMVSELEQRLLERVHEMSEDEVSALLAQLAD